MDRKENRRPSKSRSKARNGQENRIQSDQNEERLNAVAGVLRDMNINQQDKINSRVQISNDSNQQINARVEPQQQRNVQRNKSERSSIANVQVRENIIERENIHEANILRNRFNRQIGIGPVEAHNLSQRQNHLQQIQLQASINEVERLSAVDQVAHRIAQQPSPIVSSINIPATDSVQPNHVIIRQQDQIQQAVKKMLEQLSIELENKNIENKRKRYFYITKVKRILFVQQCNLKNEHQQNKKYLREYHKHRMNSNYYQFDKKDHFQRLQSGHQKKLDEMKKKNAERLKIQEQKLLKQQQLEASRDIQILKEAEQKFRNQKRQEKLQQELRLKILKQQQEKRKAEQRIIQEQRKAQEARKTLERQQQEERKAQELRRAQQQRQEQVNRLEQQEEQKNEQEAQELEQVEELPPSKTKRLGSQKIRKQREFFELKFQQQKEQKRIRAEENEKNSYTIQHNLIEFIIKKWQQKNMNNNQKPTKNKEKQNKIKL